VAGLEQRARAAAESGNSAAAADLYTQLAAASSGTTRIDYLLEAARLAADHGDTALARRRIGEARNGATAAQQQASAVLLARLELADGRPQAALDMVVALPQLLLPAAQSDAAAVRGQALFRLGRPVEAVRVLVEREIWLGDAAAILANRLGMAMNGHEEIVRGDDALLDEHGSQLLVGLNHLARLEKLAHGNLAGFE
jgi:outer membrane PBP1 activator LpoA protein